MNSSEFMEATGIKHAEYITRYIKRGIISPTKSGKSYEFTQNDVEAIANFLSNKNTRNKTSAQQTVEELSQIKFELSQINKSMDELKKIVKK